MNTDQILRMLTRLLRPLMNRGINAGINRIASRGKPEAEMTPEERSQAKGARELAGRAKKLARMSRRIGR